jgi:hypothetical protein
VPGSGAMGGKGGAVKSGASGTPEQAPAASGGGMNSGM